jgi:hypothetical protein
MLCAFRPEGSMTFFFLTPTIVAKAAEDEK